ncbi:MAG TPA: hypothetical protein ENG91_07215 [Desulfobacteraceae bacterium]|nr:hypothetical protein [Desulfobacteraceae bacterium]
MNKIDPARLGFDFDGVVADTAEAFIRLSCEEYGDCSFSLADITSFEVERCLDMNPELVETIFGRILVDPVGVGLKPMPGAVRVLEELTGYATVTLVTARPDPEPIRTWFESLTDAATSDGIRIVAMGAHDDKPRHIKGYGIEYFIDDRAETCRQLEQAGINPIVFSQPWNQGRHSFKSVASWREIRDLCFDREQATP